MAEASSPLLPAPPREKLEDLEASLLLEGIYRQYGFDFRQYAKASLRRRLWRRAYAEGLDTLTALLDRVLHDAEAMDRLLQDLSINVTSMFRDPPFFAALRSKVVPLLRTYPFLRVWVAGCSTGEETYALAILLGEVGLLPRTRIYATDINEQVLSVAAAGVYPLAKMREYTENYLAAGGSRAFSDYYATGFDAARFDPALRENVIFAQHNLVSDRSFNEFHLIICRNVMIYFDRQLQNHVHGLFLDSLAPAGVLGLGLKESLRHTDAVEAYDPIDDDLRLYRKRR